MGHPLASIISHCFVFSALLRCNYLSHPCHIQGNTLRGFDILTATEDGHNLQRHSTQAGGQAGGDSKGKTVSWTTAVRNVSNQGQGEERARDQGRGRVKDTTCLPFLLVLQMLRLLHKLPSLRCRIFTKLYQTWINAEKKVLNRFLIPAAL